VFTTADIEYCEAEGKRLLARLYLPSGPGPFPVVVEVHGGAWVGGDRLRNSAIDSFLAEGGVAVLAVDFRLPPTSTYPGSAADVNCAIRWMKANAPKFNINPEYVAGLGTSSGGHLVLLNAMRPRDRCFTYHPVPGPFDASLCKVIACWPVVDPLYRYRFACERRMQNLVEKHQAYWLSEDAMREGSPQCILDRGEDVDVPPTLVIQGTFDDNIPLEMIDRFAHSYRSAGGHIEVKKYPGMPHDFISKNPGAPASMEALQRIKSFVLSTDSCLPCEQISGGGA
jgi:acetyl esterase